MKAKDLPMVFYMQTSGDCQEYTYGMVTDRDNRYTYIRLCMVQAVIKYPNEGTVYTTKG